MPSDLLISPRCRAEHLGLPMPDSTHAVSACLPLWAHNIGYEEGDLAVIDQLQAAYPRFCLHPFVRTLISRTCNETGCSGFVFPSANAARRALDYLIWRGGKSGILVPVPQQTAVAVQVQSDELPMLKEYWQHAGEVLSSRSAERMLADQYVAYSDTDARKTVRQRVANLQNVQPLDVWLYPSGMAAMAAAWRAVRAGDAQNASVQFGFPYVDTLKIQQRFPPARYHFFPTGGEEDIRQLETILASQSISSVFCETPANPLLTCPDLRRLRALADQHNFLLIVDDTLAACTNLDVLSYADLVVTSLTKYFSGYGDVLAGSVTINPASARCQELRDALNCSHEELLADVDVEVLERNSRDVQQRVATINSNAAAVATMLHSHPAVAQVWHPSLGSNPAYDSLKRPGGGYGGLLSVVLKNPETTTQPMFDALQLCKGPNLGTWFTLCCPYTILAHYGELDFAESCGVSRWLLRISIGIEPEQELISRFRQALECI